MELVWIAGGKTIEKEHDMDEPVQLVLLIAADFQERAYLCHFLHYGWQAEPPDHVTLLALGLFITAGARRVEDRPRSQKAAEQTHRIITTISRRITMTLALSVSIGVEFAQTAFKAMLVSGGGGKFRLSF
ncbi:hypothetical protein GI374_17895 [Paracoccus sp. S-4012]|uniref:hypothetical protein n=1 Tax=Paracoccus sp. S-4012 TaxID=2665648 RepID=UPI0012AF2264|nr:hypothetical protein [Paracoccus sp. S-4012]MRX52228.1 hypothetical protein [Paracoccus sp. S-4012]